jgi:hypothetical protein
MSIQEHSQDRDLTIVAPSASDIQNTAGTKSIAVIAKTLIDNIAALFNAVGNAVPDVTDNRSFVRTQGAWEPITHLYEIGLNISGYVKFIWPSKEDFGYASTNLSLFSGFLTDKVSAYESGRLPTNYFYKLARDVEGYYNVTDYISGYIDGDYENFNTNAINVSLYDNPPRYSIRKIM